MRVIDRLVPKEVLIDLGEHVVTLELLPVIKVRIFERRDLFPLALVGHRYLYFPMLPCPSSPQLSHRALSYLRAIFWGSQDRACTLVCWTSKSRVV